MYDLNEAPHSTLRAKIIIWHTFLSIYQCITLGLLNSHWHRCSTNSCSVIVVGLVIFFLCMTVLKQILHKDSWVVQFVACFGLKLCVVFHLLYCIHLSAHTNAN